jgi:hypothetical protein
MTLPTTVTAVMGAVPPADMGRASGVNNTLQRFGGVFGVAAATAVFSANGKLGTQASLIAGYRPAIVGSAGLSLAGAAAAVAVGPRRASRPVTPA